MSSGANLPLAGTPEQQLADPLHLFPNADNALQPPAGVPAVLSSLGGNSSVPVQPYGKFVNPPAQGGGFNGMAARNAGPLFNPSASAPSWQALMAQAVNNQPQQTPVPTGGGFHRPSLGLNGINTALPGIGGGQGKDVLRILFGL